MAELEQIRQEGLRIQRDSQAEAERLQNDAMQFRQQTQQQCDALVSRSRQEASTIQEGANHYAEQVLSELEGRLQELSKVVLGGRHELGRLMASQITASERALQSNTRNPVAERESGRSTGRRLASRLRRVTEGLG